MRRQALEHGGLDHLPVGTDTIRIWIKPKLKSLKSARGKKLWGPIDVPHGRIGTGRVDLSRPHVKILFAKNGFFGEIWRRLEALGATAAVCDPPGQSY